MDPLAKLWGRAAARALLCVSLAVAVAACTSSSSSDSSGRTPEQVAADGQAQLERLSDDQFTAAIAIDQWSPIIERDDTAGFANNDSGEIFGDVGRTPTSFRWSYVVEPGVDVAAALDAAVAELEEHGASLRSTLGNSRTLEATSGQDRLLIELRLMNGETGEVRHLVKVEGG